MSAPGPTRRRKEKKKNEGKSEAPTPYERSDKSKNNLVEGETWYSKFKQKFGTRKFTATAIKKRDIKTMSRFCASEALSSLAKGYFNDLLREEERRKGKTISSKPSVPSTNERLYLSVAINEDTVTYAGFAIFKYTSERALATKRKTIVEGKPSHWLMVYDELTTSSFIPDDLFESYTDTLTEVMEDIMELHIKCQDEGCDEDEEDDKLEELKSVKIFEIYEYLRANFDDKKKSEDAIKREAEIIVAWLISAGKSYAEEFDPSDSIKGRDQAYERVNTLYLLLICADPVWKGHGLAKGLFRHLLKRVLNHRFQHVSDRLEIKLQPASTELSYLYGALGFKYPDGEYYGSGGDNYMYSPDLTEDPDALKLDESHTPRVEPMKPSKYFSMPSRLNERLMVFTEKHIGPPMRRRDQKRQKLKAGEDNLIRRVNPFVKYNSWVSPMGNRFDINDVTIERLSKETMNLMEDFCDGGVRETTAGEWFRILADSNRKFTTLSMVKEKDKGEVVGFFIFEHRYGKRKSDDPEKVYKERPRHWKIVYQYLEDKDAFFDDDTIYWADKVNVAFEAGIVSMSPNKEEASPKLKKSEAEMINDIQRDIQIRGFGSELFGDDSDDSDDSDAKYESSSSDEAHYGYDSLDSGSEAESKKTGADVIKWAYKEGKRYIPKSSEELVTGGPSVYETFVECYLHLICGSSEWSGHGISKGVARYLVEITKDIAITQKVDMCYIRLEAVNDKSKKVFASHGFIREKKTDFFESPELLKHSDQLKLFN